jgi:hypothetical protein
MIHIQKKYSFYLFILLLISGCSVPIYDQYEYEFATSLKAEALHIMSKATEQFSLHKETVEELKLNLEKAYQYSAGRKNNEISSEQWKIIKDPDRNSLGGFLKRWEAKQSLDVNFIEEAKGLVSDGFDTIIAYEGEKAK